MPIARVMNNPDGSTPTPPVGGGDVNGTLATSILASQAGTNGSALSCERHIHFQTSTMGLPGGTAPLNAMALDELKATIEAQDIAKAELAEAREEEAHEGEEDWKPSDSAPPDDPGEIEGWLEQNRAITDPPEKKEPEPKQPRQRLPRHR